jgi:hypothetical protein
MIRGSRDGSIAEVNEDLYKDSVESTHSGSGSNKFITKKIITVPH